ncbi:ADP-ribosylglycohydrolase family protein [Myxococcota bacterium]|nr:ADP-ribosylglycohydrolase family protein [Myxococcota bacterium]MBU1497467.1 ADP-ribosylglycohydrolase family protein [Myxococcota bacterium]
MIGALAGDIFGSIYEFENIKTKDFDLYDISCFFTDDSVLTCALAESYLLGRAYEDVMREYYKLWPDASYGGRYHYWAMDPEMGPYNSFGNGSAMRVSPAGWAFNDLESVLRGATASAEVTHNHPEGLKGAQATAGAIFLLRSGTSRHVVKDWMQNIFEYNVSQTCDEIRPHYQFDESCQGTVPQAFRAFYESTDFEDAIKTAISLGGDSDTLACITGALAEAQYGIPERVREFVYDRLPDRLLKVVMSFYAK